MYSSLFGMKVIESPYIPESSPVLSLRHDAPVTDQFRSEFNAWLLEMFGEQRVYLILYGKDILVNPKNAAIFREKIAKP